MISDKKFCTGNGKMETWTLNIKLEVQTASSKLKF